MRYYYRYPPLSLDLVVAIGNGCCKMVEVESGDFLFRQEGADLNLSCAETTINDSLNMSGDTTKCVVNIQVYLE